MKKSAETVMTEPATPALFDFAGKRVYVAGHRGMVGSALVRRLKSESCEILTVDRTALDLTRQAETEHWMATATWHSAKAFERFGNQPAWLAG